MLCTVCTYVPMWNLLKCCHMYEIKHFQEQLLCVQAPISFIFHMSVTVNICYINVYDKLETSLYYTKRNMNRVKVNIVE